MNKQSIALIAVVFVALRASSAGAAPAPDAKSTVDRFITLYLAQLHGSFPDAKGLKALRPLATPRLNNLLIGAARGIACQQKTTGGNEPPPTEGDIFVSLFEGATSVEDVTPLEADASHASFGISWVYKDPSPGREDQEIVRWTDRVLLTKTHGAWLIEDLLHDGQWEFATPGKVSEHLAWVAGFCRKS